MLPTLDIILMPNFIFGREKKGLIKISLFFAKKVQDGLNTKEKDLKLNDIRDLFSQQMNIISTELTMIIHGAFIGYILKEAIHLCSLQ
jgi:hypothetical protein